jgi:hypothetical protein
MALPDINNALWGLSKAEIRKAIKDADEVHMFIHPDYWAWKEGTAPPRLKVTAAYATDFMANRHKMPESALPGIEVYDFNGKKALMIWPANWEPID